MDTEPPKAFTIASLRLYLICFVGFLCSTMAGYDGSMLGGLLQNHRFTDFLKDQTPADGWILFPLFAPSQQFLPAVLLWILGVEGKAYFLERASSLPVLPYKERR